MAPASARSHRARRLAARQEAGEAGHLPDLGIDLGGRLEDGKTHVGADVENEDLDRPDRPLDRLEEGGDVGFLARVEPERVRFAAVRADALRQRLQRLDVARTPRHADREALAGEGARDRAAEALARPDHHADAALRLAHADFL